MVLNNTNKIKNSTELILLLVYEFFPIPTFLLNRHRRTKIIDRKTTSTKEGGGYNNKGTNKRMESRLTTVPCNVERKEEKELKKVNENQDKNTCLKNVFKLKSEVNIKRDTTSYMRLGHDKFCFHSTLIIVSSYRLDNHLLIVYVFVTTSAYTEIWQPGMFLLLMTL